MLKKLALAAADRAGYSVIPKWRQRRAPFANALQKIFDRHRIDTVLDVGANRGGYIEFLRAEVGFTGQIISFEPLPDLVAELRRIAEKDGRITVMPYALGEADGELTLYKTEGDELTSALKPKENVNPEWQYRDLMQTSGTLTVPVRRLDDCLPATIDLSRTYLKLDTQGYDLRVARAATRIIAAVPALQSEVSVQPIYEDMPTMEESIRFFAASGFAVSDLFVISKDQALRAIEFDCLMVRR